MDQVLTRKGLGTLLMVLFEKLCKSPGIFSSTNKTNLPAQKLLEKREFERSGSTDNLEEGDPELDYYKPLKRSNNICFV